MLRLSTAGWCSFPVFSLAPTVAHCCIVFQVIDQDSHSLTLSLLQEAVSPPTGLAVLKSASDQSQSISVHVCDI